MTTRTGAGNGAAPVCHSLPHSLVILVARGVLGDGCCYQVVTSVMVVKCAGGGSGGSCNMADGRDREGVDVSALALSRVLMRLVLLARVEMLNLIVGL